MDGQGCAGGILGLGHDVVALDAFAEQLESPDGGMRRLFSPRELRQSALRGRLKADGEAVHLAARWAGKEAVVKAWCEALGESGPLPYTVDTVPWAGIEILDDARGVPHVVLADDVARALSDAVHGVYCGVHCGVSAATDADTQPQGGARWLWHISLSHDGPVASAVAILVVRR
ncbi:MAG: holo-ACP synthase [Bifidobacterium thermacidophilum]|nr:holo-ACP synthase [Bifidobacterium thermacidophilum]